MGGRKWLGDRKRCGLKKETAGSEDMFQKVEEKYQKTVNAIKGLE